MSETDVLFEGSAHVAIRLLPFLTLKPTLQIKSPLGLEGLAQATGKSVHTVCCRM